MYRDGKIRELHVELTERCNALCPMCGRTGRDGAPNPKLAGRELDLAAFQAMVDAKTLAQLRTLLFCGNYGEPVAARDFLPIVDWARGENPAVRLRVHTNGSLRPQAWWSALGARFRGEGSYVRFALDGLEDTHALYRRGTSFAKILAHARAFIAAGGRAEWAFLVFRHNEHQVDAARALARDLGFVRFVPKATKRFLGQGASAVRAQIGALEPPVAAAYQHAGLARARNAGSLASVYDLTPIACRASDKRSAYLDARGRVFPCCWVAAELMGAESEPARASMTRWEAEAGAGAGCVREQLASKLFRETIPAAQAKRCIADGKPRVCARVCGTELGLFRGQFVEPAPAPAEEPP